MPLVAAYLFMAVVITLAVLMERLPTSAGLRAISHACLISAVIGALWLIVLACGGLDALEGKGLIKSC